MLTRPAQTMADDRGDQKTSALPMGWLCARAGIFEIVRKLAGEGPGVGRRPVAGRFVGGVVSFAALAR